MAEWLRIRLPTQGTRVQSLVQEDPTCHRATKSVCHNYWACALEPVSHNYWAHMLQLWKPACLEPVLLNKRSHHNKKPEHHNEDPTHPQINKIKKKKKEEWSRSFGILRPYTVYMNWNKQYNSKQYNKKLDKEEHNPTWHFKEVV